MVLNRLEPRIGERFALRGLRVRLTGRFFLATQGSYLEFHFTLNESVWDCAVFNGFTQSDSVRGNVPASTARTHFFKFADAGLEAVERVVVDAPVFKDSRLEPLSVLRVADVELGAH
jgi:hypothetical protein